MLVENHPLRCGRSPDGFSRGVTPEGVHLCMWFKTFVWFSAGQNHCWQWSCGKPLDEPSRDPAR